MKITIFPGKYHQNGGFSMAMLVSGRVHFWPALTLDLHKIQLTTVFRFQAIRDSLRPKQPKTWDFCGFFIWNPLNLWLLIWKEPKLCQVKLRRSFQKILKILVSKKPKSLNSTNSIIFDLYETDGNSTMKIPTQQRSFFWLTMHPEETTKGAHPSTKSKKRSEEW